MDPSDALAERIRGEAEKLTRYFDRITSCRVTVEAPERHHHHGAPFHIRIELTVPGKELVVSREPAVRAALALDPEGERPHKHDELQVEHKDAYVAIRDSFSAMRRQLQDYVRCLRQT